MFLYHSIAYHQRVVTMSSVQEQARTRLSGLAFAVESPELSIFITSTRIAPPSPPTHPHTAGYARPVARTPIPVAFR
jgi:hypothetical protein